MANDYCFSTGLRSPTSHSFGDFSMNPRWFQSHLTISAFSNRFEVNKKGGVTKTSGRCAKAHEHCLATALNKNRSRIPLINWSVLNLNTEACIGSARRSGSGCRSGGSAAVALRGGGGSSPIGSVSAGHSEGVSHLAAGNCGGAMQML